MGGKKKIVATNPAALLSTPEAAAALGLKPARVRQMCDLGQIECFKVGLNWAIPLAAVEAARNRKTKPGPAPKTEAA